MSPPGDADPIRVLVIEDDPAVAAVHCRFISRQAGFVVAGRASTGEEAQRFVATGAPDLILLDLGIPAPNGVELLRQFRRGGRPVEVIVVTAHASPRAVQAAMQLGVVDYLVKPFWVARLGEALRAAEARILTARRGVALDQAAIDRLRGTVAAGDPDADGVRQGRLESVREALAAADQALTADDVAAATRIARVTARRYLEHLVSRGECTVDAVPNGPGRPSKAYRLWLSAPVNDINRHG